MDLPEGKNLVGAFHQPTAIVIDIELLRTLPGASSAPRSAKRSRWRCSVTTACSGCSESDGRDRVGDASAFASGAVAELVERAGWAEVKIVAVDERSGRAGGRITLNLGTRSATPSRRPRAMAGCSMARRSPMACARRFGSAWRPG